MLFVSSESTERDFSHIIFVALLSHDMYEEIHTREFLEGGMIINN